MADLPHSRVKAAARDRAKSGGGDDWSSDIDDRLLGDCHQYQLDAVTDDALRVSILAGRGGGKTVVLRVRALRRMVRVKNARVIYAATSRPEAERLNWEPIKELIDQLGLRDEFVFNEGRLRCTCRRTGSTYQLVGIDDKKEVNKYRGQPFDEVQVDETASHDPVLLEMFLDRAVGPRLGERHGAIVIAGTPGHVLRGRFYEATRKGSELHRPYGERDDPELADWVGWSSHGWNIPMVLALDGADRYPAMALNWEANLIEKQRQRWSDNNPIWMREYLGIWASDHTTSMYAYQAHGPDGMPFNRWAPYGDEKLEGIPMLTAAIAALPDEYSDWLYGYGADLGARDPFALTILAFSPQDPWRRFFHVFSFERRKMYPKSIAELLIGEECVAKAMRGETYDRPGGLIGVTGWPVAAVADLAGLGEMVTDELASVYGVKFKAAVKRDKPGAIEVVNGDLVDARLLVLAGSILEEQFSSLQYRPDEHDNPKEDKSAANHSADSATYIRAELGAMFSGIAPPALPKGSKEGDLPPATKTAFPASPRKSTGNRPKIDAWGDKPIGVGQVSGDYSALMRG